MPQRPAAACSRPGCRGLVRADVCSVCGPRRRATYQQYDAQRGTTAERGYGSSWQRLRAVYLRSHPNCAECAKAGRVESAVDVHHIIPLRDGGSNEASNLMALCHPCHSKYTDAEKRRS